MNRDGLFVTTLQKVNMTKNGLNFGQNRSSRDTGGMHQVMIMAPQSSGISVDFRKSIILYFSFLQLEKGVLSGLPGVLTGGGSKLKGVVDSIKKAKSENWVAESGSDKTILESITSALNTAKENIPQQIMAPLTEAIGHLIKMLPEIIKGMLFKLSNLSVPILSNIGKIASCFKTAISKAIVLWKQKGLLQALRDGAPKKIVEKLLDMLKKDIVSAVGEAAWQFADGIAAGLTGGASALVSKVASAIKGFIQFIWIKFKEFREYYALKLFFADCAEKRLSINNPWSIVYKNTEFSQWLSGWLSELPILAAHCICSKGTGNAAGFLSTFKSDGSAASDEDLIKAYEKFTALKKPATAYAKDYTHKFTSGELIIQRFLEHIDKGHIDLSDGEAARASSIFGRIKSFFGR